MAPASTQWKTLPVCAASDGDRSRWPERGLTAEDPAHYLNRLGSRYMREKGLAQNGENYTLDRLPNGYALFGKRRIKEPTHVDRYLYGHPKYTFRSAEEFYDHFKSLMDTGSTAQCKCIGCGPGKKRGRPKADPNAPSKTPSQKPPKSKPGPKVGLRPTRPLNNDTDVFMETPLRPDTFPRQAQRSVTPDYDKVDEEGIPDVYRNLVDRLEKDMTMDEPIEETKSFDWQINRKSIGPFMKALAEQPAFQPRIGEIVLFVRGLTPSQLISLDKDKQTFVVWDTQQEILISMPPWEAGIITEAPAEPITMADLVVEQTKEHQINYSGFRIEPMSAPTSDDKHLSKRAASVRLQQIRPFNMYRQMLRGIQPKDFHPTVANALMVLSTFCLFERYHFKGWWPDASVFCRGLFLGAEFLTIGDTVRLLPGQNAPDTNQVWDVMKITSIKLRMIHLDGRDNPEYEAEEERWYDSCVHVDGIAFTRDQSRALGMGKFPLAEDDEDLPASLQGYGSWYRLHDPKKRWKVPFSRLLGRLYEADAVKLWFSSVSNAPSYPKLQSFAAINSSPGIPDTIIPAEAVDISRGLKDVVSGRRFSSQRDPRIDDKGGQLWYWADHRAEQLDLHEVKGQTVTAFIHGRPTRDTRAWTRAMRIREKGAGHRAKPDMSNVSFGGPTNVASSLVAASAAVPAVDKEEEEVEESESEEESVTPEPANDAQLEDESDVEMAEADKEVVILDPAHGKVMEGAESSEEDLSAWIG
ncbi:Hypothetical protein D9617_1g079790 [Elsinoe fawcettii]|nr:Hypothetical protein D9617_1g079790 [Elsinoe fawcettii]